MEGSYFFNALAALFILLQLTTHMNTCSAARPSPNEAYAEFIKTSCRTTTYPQLCTSSLLSYASKIQTSPKILADTALSIALATAHSTSTAITKLSKTQGLKPGEAAAIRDCVEVLGDSEDELQMSIQEMEHPEGKSFGLQMSDIQTWVSAALTNDDTCMDSFAGNAMNGNVKTIVRGYILHVAQMTSVALALINNYALGQTTSP